MNRNLLLAAFLALAAILAGNPSMAADPMAYVDLDGDGFNDNDLDADGDGIPDEFEPGYVPEIDEGEAAGIFADLEVAPVETETTVLLETNEDVFGRLSFLTRNICENRCVFDADFGSGLGIAVAAGGACAGGVCRPRG
jgi:hypothetical protein